jgi:hypothetical protein
VNESTTIFRFFRRSGLSRLAFSQAVNSRCSRWRALSCYSLNSCYWTNPHLASPRSSCARFSLSSAA